MKRVLEVERVEFGYPGNDVLKDVSFHADAGELVCVIGPNGSGKTTLVNVVSRTVRPQKGRVRVLDEDISGMAPKRIAAAIAVVRQTQAPAAMSVKSYVCLGRLPYFKKYQFFETASDMDIVSRAMEMTGIRALESARMNAVSGGERQLAAIARALAQQPALLVLDEPTAHLDIRHQARIFDILIRLKEETALAAVMVQHDLNLASQFADRLVLLDKRDGRIFAAGGPEEVLTRQTVQKVYRTRVRVDENPVSGKPSVFLDSQFSTTPRKGA